MMNDSPLSFHDRPSLDDRQKAERKLCRLFKSFGIDAMTDRERLIDPYLDRGARFWRPHSGSDFAALAVQEAHADLEMWFVSLLETHLEDRRSAVMAGRAAFLMCDGPSTWADQLLAPLDDLPEAFVDALVEGMPSATPESDLGEMHHQPYQAWSPTAFMARALPTDGGLFQSLGWRGTTTSR